MDKSSVIVKDRLLACMNELLAKDENKELRSLLMAAFCEISTLEVELVKAQHKTTVPGIFEAMNLTSLKK